MFLIVGGDSEVGGAAQRAFRARRLEVAATTRRRDRADRDRPFLDLSAPLDCWEPPPGTRAVCVCAALARLAACAADPEATSFINVHQTAALSAMLLARGIYVLFLSSNQVFDGRAPLMPADAPYSPVSEYGRQKMRMETLLREHMARGAPAAILRLAKVVAAPMPLIEGWITELSEGRPIRAFVDMTFAPTPMDLVCAAIGSLLDERATGIFQLTGPRDIPYVEAGQFVASHLGASSALVMATRARDAGLPDGATPPHTTLDSSRLRDRYGYEAPDAMTVIAALLAARQSAG